MNTYRGGTRILNALSTTSAVNGVLAAALMLFAVAGAAPSHAEEAKKAGGETLDCLPIAQIRQTKIIDDQNIVFMTRANKFYNNHLPHKCGGLKSADKFRYKTSQSQLCSVDVITVLQNAGASLMDGASCGLGSFTPTVDPNKKDKSS